MHSCMCKMFVIPEHKLLLGAKELHTSVLVSTPSQLFFYLLKFHFHIIIVIFFPFSTASLRQDSEEAGKVVHASYCCTYITCVLYVALSHGS